MARTCPIVKPFMTEFSCVSCHFIQVNNVAVMTTHLLLCSFKGLVVDLEDGNLVKLADDGTVLRYIQHLACFPIPTVFLVF